ncbi:MAG: hypothetical protein Q7T81_05350 [Pseudolabrys sp.]|nr:hypothetical protein [Pseudolabrys sp.]
MQHERDKVLVELLGETLEDFLEGLGPAQALDYLEVASATAGEAQSVKLPLDIARSLLKLFERKKRPNSAVNDILKYAAINIACERKAELIAAGRKATGVNRDSPEMSAEDQAAKEAMDWLEAVGVSWKESTIKRHMESSILRGSGKSR